MKRTRQWHRQDLFGETYKEEPEFIPKPKLRNGMFVIGRMLALCHKGSGMSKDEAARILANELRGDWIAKNVYPAHEKSVIKSILRDYEAFRVMRKTERRKDRPPPENWFDKALKFNADMVEKGYDIRATSKPYEITISEFYGVKMTADDEKFYNDNCHGSYTATCSSTIPRSWLKQKQRNEERAAREEQVRDENRQMESNTIGYLSDDMVIDEDDTADPDYAPNIVPSENPVSNVTLTTRSSAQTTDQPTSTSSPTIPPVPIRTGKNSLNESLMRCLVYCSAQFKVTTNDLLGITAALANTVFDQNWELPHNINDDVDGVDDEDDEPERKRQNKDFTFILPSRKRIANYIEDASFLNLAMLTDTLLNLGDSVVTIGIDDTTKAAGYRLFDVKTDHFTITSQDGQRQTFTTGYTENSSHSGEKGAEAVRFKLQCLAILGDTTVEDIISNIHFWITDRAGDCKTLLDQLEVSEDRILKCSAHLILCVDHAIEKTFKDTEQKADVQKLIRVDNILRNQSSSIHTLGLIALAKLLSPSHAAHSVSLYGELKEWLIAQGLDAAHFKGFVSNRFGRVVELAREFLKNRETLLAFFDSIVDENANKLVLAVSTFISNPWFICCNEVYALIGEMIIYPLMDLLGIDGRGGIGRRQWSDVKVFFDEKIPELERRHRHFSLTSTGKGQLISAVLDEVVDSVKRQLSEMDYFSADVDECTVDVDRLQLAPLTNLGCESEFSKLSSRVKVTGGMTTIQTHSKKNVIATNGLLVNSSFVQMTASERRGRWKWARASQEVRNAKRLEADFIATVKAAKRIALVKKEERKKKKAEKTMTLLESCKKHGGPITPASIDSLQRLSEKQLLTEISFLRQTVCPDIRQKRRVKAANGRYRFQTFSLDELRQSITTALKPDTNVTDDIDGLIRVALSKK